ncbi:MAG: TlpA family protein disulfide reductase [Candidatus Rokuibacteriota bacterium]|nr:MAG: TlpA family protein disulfide reductase [Candidatus Rokubacteria bacterium]
MTRVPPPAEPRHSRTAPPARFAVTMLGGVVCAASLLMGEGWAEPSRFLPWKDPAAPHLALDDLGGRAHTLADYRGSVVLLNFWATWCEPCRAEMVSMRALQQRLAGRPFVILLVNYGEARTRVSEFAKRESLELPILLDPNQDAPRAWRVRVLPSSFLLGPDGHVRYGVIGEIDWVSAEAVRIVQELLR